MSWQPMLRAPIGLRNLGNTCYLNSVLQCLTYTPPLANFCLKHLHTTSCDTRKVSAGEKKSECPFCIIEKRISRSLSTELALDSPLKINNCLKIFAEHFRHGRQEDAHEFLRYVIDACHNTCLRIKKLQQQRRKGGYIENGNCNQNGNGHTVVKEIFGGALQSQVKCLSCGAESNKVDEMMDISLDVLHSGSVKDALQRFFQPEILDGNNKYKCENCKKFVAARKQMSLLQAPNVLVIQLKRFEGIYGGKIDKSIAFEEVLVLSSYMCKASQDPNPEYTLFGTIVHSGFSADTGHYYAYIKDAMGRWYCCNDSFVSVSSLKEVLSEKVYVLFFSRTKQRPGPSHTGVSVNGAKSNAPNGLHSSKILKSGCLEKPVPTKQNGLPLNSSPSKTSKSLPTPPRKPIVSENSGRKPPKAPAAGCIKIVVHSKESMDKNGHVVSREVKEKPVFSMVDRNGIAKSKTSYAVNRGKMQSSSSQPLIDKNGVGKSESYAAEDALKKKSLTSLSGIDSNGVTKPESGDSSNAERNKSLHVATPLSGDSVGRSEIGYTIDDVRKSAPLSNGNGKLPSFTTDHSVGHHENRKSNGTLTTSSPRKMVGDGCSVDDNTGLKRKFVDEDESILLARDTKSQIKVEEFKELIGREAASFLQSCGWSNKVYEHMQHSRKKLRAQEVGCDASNHLELKRLLIADAKTTFISQIPDSVKGTLIEHLKSFSREKSSSIT